MDRNDWIDMLADWLAGEDHRTALESDMAIDLLDSRIPAACPDCKGEGVYTLPEWEGRAETCHHDFAPTVEQVLTVGLRTLATGDGAFPWSWHDEKIKPDDPLAAYWLGADRMLNYLRTGRALRGEDA